VDALQLQKAMQEGESVGDLLDPCRSESIAIVRHRGGTTGQADSLQSNIQTPAYEPDK